MVDMVYYFSLALLLGETGPRPTYPAPPADLIKRMTKVPTCVSLPATSRPSLSRLSLPTNGGSLDESAVIAGVNSIAEKLPQTKCEIRAK